MTENDEAVSIVVQVRRDLAQIEKLCRTDTATILIHVGTVARRPGFIGPMPQGFRRVRTSRSRLLTQAVHDGNNPLMPGGEAMVSLAHVANLEWWEHKLEVAEEAAEARSWVTGEPTMLPEIEDNDEREPPLQTLRFWSERWRTATNTALTWTDDNNVVHGRRATMASELNFLSWAVDWAHQNEPRFTQFVRDVARARTHTENVLHDGSRSERGVPCLYEECKGKRLVRKLTPGRDEDGNKVWFHTPWHCPSCHREWDEDQYARMKTAAAEAAKVEDLPIVAGTDYDPADIVAYETWCSVDYAAQRVGRPAATIRVWVHRGHVATACLLAGRRMGYVRLADVEACHTSTKSRQGHKRQPGEFVEQGPVRHRIESRILRDENGCWLWQGAVDKVTGYGRITVQRSGRYAHRVSYEEFVGPIPAGLQIDHLCRVRRCVNPEHLEPVTPQVNVDRAIAARSNAR